MVAKIMHGARALVKLVDGSGERSIGIFSQCSYDVAYDVQPAYILGRYSAAELDYTAAEVVTITCSGWRVFGHGWHRTALLPRIQDLMTHEYIRFVIYDRQSALPPPAGRGELTPVAIINHVRPASAGGGYSARQLADMTVRYIGILADDESGQNYENPANEVDLPSD